MATATMDTASDTLSMLEERLARIDFLVNGNSSNDGPTTSTPKSSTSASARLRTLERSLQSLANHSSTIASILQLHKQHPELFHPSDALTTIPTSLPPASLAQLVLAHDKLYRTSASQLSTLNDNRSIPDPSSLTKLIAMQPRIGKLEVKQKEQAREFAELRARSARIVKHWYENGVLDMGDKWAEWEERLRDCEILVRRKEAAKKREDGVQ